MGWLRIIVGAGVAGKSLGGAQVWRGASQVGLRLLFDVDLSLVRVTHGKIPVRVFFSTDLAMPVVDIIETYAGRWRTAPFVGYTYTLLVLWFATNATSSSPLATPPLRPWYRH